MTLLMGAVCNQSISGAVRNRTYGGRGSAGACDWKPHLPVPRLVGAVSNRTVSI